jgi:hypothetical protein
MLISGVLKIQCENFVENFGTVINMGIPPVSQAEVCVVLRFGSSSLTRISQVGVREQVSASFVLCRLPEVLLGSKLWRMGFSVPLFSWAVKERLYIIF